MSLSSPTDALVPHNTRLSCSIKANKASQSFMLTLATNNDTVIKLVTMFSEVLFDKEVKSVHPLKPTSTLTIAIKPTKFIPTALVLKVVVGVKTGVQDHVFELSYQLPRFGAFIMLRPREMPEPVSSVSFRTTERVNRVVLWIHQNFNLEPSQPLQGLNMAAGADSLHVGFLNIKNNMPLFIKMVPDNGGQLQIRTDDMDLAGDLVQDLCKYLKLDHLESIVDFPLEMTKFNEVLERVEAHNAQRLKLSAEMADAASAIKTILVRAEDSRLLHHMEATSEYYKQLYELNQGLIGEYNKRAHNHAELLTALKEVNVMIQKAARLRMGSPKTKVITACREAIKVNNVQALLKIIKMGHSS